MAPPKKFEDALDECFQALDANADGKVSKSELAKLIAALLGFKQGQVPPEVVDVVMKHADKDKSGFISKDEIADAMGCIQGLCLAYHLECAFRELDKDGNGYLTRDELMQMVKGKTQGKDQEVVSNLMQHMDADADGKISREEFVKCCCQGLVVQKK